jgi:hypothetical protein
MQFLLQFIPHLVSSVVALLVLSSTRSMVLKSALLGQV